MRAALVCLALTLAPRLHAQPSPEPVSLPRVGDVIGPEERRYFGLFPSLDGEDAVRLERRGADSVQVVAASGSGAGSVRLRLSAAEADALADLLARYEALLLDPDPSFEAFRVSGLVRWRRPFQDVRAWTTLTPRSGPDVRGVLLHAGEDGLVLSTAPPPFRGFQSVEGLVWVGASDVLRVRYDGFWSRLDLRPGGAREPYLQHALPTLRKEATFRWELPPELEAWRLAHVAMEAGGPKAGAPSRDYARLPLSRWRVALQYGPGRIDAGATTTRLFGGGGTVVNEWGGAAVNVGARVDYAVTPAAGVGVGVEWAETDEISGSGLDVRQFSTLAADLTVSYAVIRPQLRTPLLPSVTARAGGTVVRATSQTTLAYYWPNREYTASATLSDRGVDLGVTAGVELAFRLSRGTSILFGYDVAAYPWAEEGPMELDDPRVDLIVKTIEPRGFTLRRMGGTVGIAVHLGGP